MYKVEFYRYNAIRDAYELIRRFEVDAEFADEIIGKIDLHKPMVSDFYRYVVYDLSGNWILDYYTVAIDLFNKPGLNEISK